MKTTNLNMVRAQKAIAPNKEQIKEALEKANKNTTTNRHKLFLPDVYTR